MSSRRSGLMFMPANIKVSNLSTQYKGHHTRGTMDDERRVALFPRLEAIFFGLFRMVPAR
jgi:hypothetical protein